MLISALLFVALSLGRGAHAFALPADQSANVDWKESHRDISKIVSRSPVDSGHYDGIVIPELSNYNLTQRNGSLVWDLPLGGIDISEELFFKLGGNKIPALEKRDCPDNPCDCGSYKTWHLTDVNWNRYLGPPKVMSAPLCGPGSITRSYTASFSWTISGTATTGFGIPGSVWKGLDLSVGFSYTTGDAIATGYGATCSAEHPCIVTFKPYIGKVRGMAKWTQLSNGGNKLCSTGISGDVELDIPALERDCGRKDCGADGVWDHCYFLGDAAKRMCPNIGPTADAKPECPRNLYPGGA